MKKGLQNHKIVDVWHTQLNDYVTGLGWSNDGCWLCASSTKGEVSIINTSDFSVRLISNAHNDGIICLAHSPNKNRFLTGGQDGKICLWNTEEGRVFKSLEGGSSWVEHAQWSPDGEYFASASGRILRIWSKDGEMLNEYKEEASTISALYWKSDSTEIIYACYGGVKFIRKTENNSYETLPWQNSMISLFWSPDSKFICAGTQDNCLHVWPLPYKLKSDFQMSGYPNKIKNITWDSESKYMATPSAEDVVLWKFAGQLPIGTRPQKLSGHHFKISTLQFQNRGKYLATGDINGEVLLWYPEEVVDTSISKLNLNSEISAINWAPNDMRLAIGTRNGLVVLAEISL
jgi:WD40 repeat protein